METRFEDRLTDYLSIFQKANNAVYRMQKKR